MRSCPAATESRRRAVCTACDVRFARRAIEIVLTLVKLETTLARDKRTWGASNGHLRVVEWLHANRSEGCTTLAMDDAAANGHLHVVVWLHANRDEGCSTSAMDWAAASGHLCVVQWLHTNRTEGCTTSATDNAARSGHLCVVQWLHTNA